MVKRLKWDKMNDFFPSEEFNSEFEMGDVEGGQLHRCPLCLSLMHQVFIRAGDTPIFSGWGPCQCKPPDNF